MAATNADYDWDLFNSQWYKGHNYGHLREDDQEILEIVRDHFAKTPIRPGLRGIDVGAGANLYPALSMLPFCDIVELYEYSAANVSWLREQVTDLDSSWADFWDVLRKDAAYDKVDPHRRLAEVARVTQGSVFDLPTEERWDMATMFFVAESLTNVKYEFCDAVSRVTASLAPGARFAMAFMKDSAGYLVDDTAFPAVAINVSDVSQCFKDDRAVVEYHEVELKTDNPLRDGYGGMIVATGVMNGGHPR